MDTGGPVTGFNGTRDSGEFLEANPYGLVPAMTHGELTLYESQAICQYLAELLGGPMSAQNGAERARINMYGLSSIANFEPLFLPMVFSGVNDAAMAKLSPLLDALNTELEGRSYLIGEGEGRFTVADVMMASVIGQYGRAIKFDFSRWPNVQSWVNGTTKRPAFYPPRVRLPDLLEGLAGRQAV